MKKWLVWSGVILGLLLLLSGLSDIQKAAFGGNFPTKGITKITVGLIVGLSSAILLTYYRNKSNDPNDNLEILAQAKRDEQVAQNRPITWKMDNQEEKAAQKTTKSL